MMMAMTSMDSCFLTSPKSLTTTTNTLEVLVHSIKPRITFLSNKSRIKRSSFLSCCHRGSPSPEYDAIPSINTDWRSFRARLVAGEVASGPENSSNSVDPGKVEVTEVDDKWVHPLVEPERGCLLIATDKLNGVHIFERTVILLLSMGPVGPTGIILNRPSLMSIKETTRSTALDMSNTFSEMPLFFGGPVEEGLFLVRPEGVYGGAVGKSGVFEEVMEGLYYGTKESVGCAAEMVKRKVVKAREFRFFDGCCGWEKDQLKGEIRAGYWAVAACSPTVIGLSAVGSVGLWEEILGLMGQRKVW